MQSEVSITIGASMKNRPTHRWLYSLQMDANGCNRRGLLQVAVMFLGDAEQPLAREPRLSLLGIWTRGGVLDRFSSNQPTYPFFFHDPPCVSFTTLFLARQENPLALATDQTKIRLNIRNPDRGDV